MTDSASPADEESRSQTADRRVVSDPRTWLAFYLIVLALIAFWPAHVDQGMAPLLRSVTDLIPMLTYGRVEFSGNIALFVPLGILLALILRRRGLIVPIALSATVIIESVQSLMGGARTASLRDVVANLTGACAGWLLIEVLEWIRRSPINSRQ